LQLNWLNSGCILPKLETLLLAIEGKSCIVRIHEAGFSSAQIGWKLSIAHQTLYGVVKQSWLQGTIVSPQLIGRLFEMEDYNKLLLVCSLVVDWCAFLLAI
jgi:hypothetical protein